MTAIPCVDYFEESPALVPRRARRANPDAIRDLWANFVYSMDLTPSTSDDRPGNALGAWSLWDLPVTHASQIDDDRGDDLIVVAIQNDLFWLDWTRYRDEWSWNAFAPIRRVLRFGPIPSSSDDVGRAFRQDVVKRFREFEFALKDAPNDGTASRWKVTVAEWDNEEATARSASRYTSQRMRTKVAVRGRQFVVQLENSANDPLRIEHWRAVWDELGRRIKQAGVA